MALETVNNIADLVITNPTSIDPKSEGDDHIRNIKKALKTDLPNITGPITATQAELNVLDGITASTAELNLLDGVTATTAELNHVDGVTSPIQTQLDAKAPLASPALTGTPTAPTAAANTNTTQIATTAHVFAERTNAATLTNKTLTAPVINSPTGIVKGDVGLGNVDNTSDLNKPISTATQTALNNKQPLDADLTAIAAITSTGLLARTGSGSASTRTLTAGTGITITNGDGVSGNPTIAVDSGGLPASASSALISYLPAGTGAVSTTVQSKLREFVSVLDYIPDSEHAAIQAGTSTYDCYPAIMAAINASTFSSGNVYYDAAPPIYFPLGKYRCNSTIELKKWVKFYGHQARTIAAPTIVFPAGVTGIIIHRFNTIGSGVESPPTKGADCSVIEGLRIQGGGAHATPAYGIWVRGGCVLRDLWVDNFSSDGISVQATAGGGGAAEGNSNSFQIYNVRSWSNGRHGIYVDGADTNAGLIYGCDLNSNAQWGLLESSFLGNTIIACHADGNGLGGYKSEVINLGSIFIGNYCEGSQAVEVPAPSLWIGGQIIDAFTNIGCLLRGSIKGVEVSGLYTTSPDATLRLTSGKTAGGTSSVEAVELDSNTVWRLKKGAVGHVMWDWNNLNLSDFLHFYDRVKATTANGYLRDLSTWGGYGGVPPGLPRGYLGANMTARIDDLALPAGGTWRRGDIVYGLNASAGGKIGWVCTTAGTMGSTAVFKTFGAIDV